MKESNYKIKLLLNTKNYWTSKAIFGQKQFIQIESTWWEKKKTQATFRKKIK